jgi:hypothetical protein
VVLRLQDRPQHTDRGHVERSIGEPAEDDGIPPHRTRGRCAIPGCVRRVPEDIAAVRVEAARSFAEMGPPPVQFREMADELDGSVTLADGERLQAREERVVRQAGRGGENVFVHDRV